MTLDPLNLRRAFSRFVTGVTVVTMRTTTGQFLGFTANSFTSVSLDPPLVLVCPGNHLSSFEMFKGAAQFGISILAEGQEDVSNLFASATADRFAGCDWGLCGDVPLIDGRAAGFVCNTHRVVDAGDHVVLMGQVAQFDDAGHAGLGYGPNGYFTQSRERKAEAPTGPGTRASALIDDGTQLFLTKDGDLPSVAVPPGQSPLRVLQGGLKQMGLSADLNVVYAIYDEGQTGRRVVFRADATGALPGLTPHPIAGVANLPNRDPALGALLGRFAGEHRAQSFGFYLGNEHDGDVTPIRER